MWLIFIKEVELMVDRSALPRKEGDPLECECPVCTRVKRLVEASTPFEDVGDADNAEKDVSDTKDRRLAIVSSVTWSGDGRWI